MKCDIVFLAHGRPEFTMESWRMLVENTNWERVHCLTIYTDGYVSVLEDSERIRLENLGIRYGKIDLINRALGGPVNIMNHYLANNPAPVWAKIDNDVIVPPFWLDEGLSTMEDHPELSFLGLEPPASRTRSPYGGKLPDAPESDCLSWTVSEGIDWTAYAKCDAIGGVGFMRTSAWDGRPPMTQHSTYGGFTDWQQRNPDLVKGWIVPPIKLFLLDRLPIEPWASLSKKYEAAGQQRFWTRYPLEAASQLWEWWL